MSETELHDFAPLAHDCLTAAAKAAPARPEDQREEETNRADDHQDPSDGGDVEPSDRRVDREGEDRTDRDQEQADSDSHCNSSLSSNAERQDGYPPRDGTKRTGRGGRAHTATRLL